MSFFKPLIAIGVALSLSACGFQLRQSYNLPAEIQTLSVTSFDSYGKLLRELKFQLQQHDITLVEPSETVTNLHLSNENYSESTLSLYQNATVAQRQFAYNTNYRVTVPNKGIYNFSAAISRIYLDNPLSALSKSVEQDMLMQEMRLEATKQIMRQLAELTADIEAFEAEQAKQLLLNEQYKTGDNEELNIEIRYQGKE